MVLLPKAGVLGDDFDKRFTPDTNDPEYVARFIARRQQQIDHLTDLRESGEIHADFVDPLVIVRMALDKFLRRDPIRGDFHWSSEDLEGLGNGGQH